MGQRQSAQVRVRLTPRSWYEKTSSCERVEVTFILGPKLPRESGKSYFAAPTDPETREPKEIDRV